MLLLNPGPGRRTYLGPLDGGTHLVNMTNTIKYNYIMEHRQEIIKIISWKIVRNQIYLDLPYDGIHLGEKAK